ncbi:MAG TPA: hypothetical protein VH744_01810, partial [Terriglobales bacterium]
QSPAGVIDLARWEGERALQRIRRGIRGELFRSPPGGSALSGRSISNAVVQQERHMWHVQAGWEPNVT